MSLYRRFKDRFGTAGVILGVIAIVRAIGGSAFAASGLNGKQKKEVKAIAKSIGGKEGPAGPTGPAGTNGTNGKDGAAGTNGTNGTNGQSVTVTNENPGGNCTEGGKKLVSVSGTTYVCNGEEGTPGNDGADGLNGSNASFEYLFNTDTANSDPGSGMLKLDNAAPGSATKLRISETDNESTAIDAAIATWVSGPGAKGSLMVRKVSSQSAYALYTITANEDAGAYDNLTVTFASGNGTFGASDPVTVQYFASAAVAAPHGTLMKGVWSVQGMTAAAADENIPVAFSTGVPISTSSINNVVYRPPGSPAEPAEPFGCTGTANAPTASATGPPATLCIYGQSATKLKAPPVDIFGTVENLAKKLKTTGGGIVILFRSELAGEVSGFGSWALNTP